MRFYFTFIWLALLTAAFCTPVALGQVIVWEDDFNDNDISDWDYNPASCSVSGGQVHLSHTDLSYHTFTSPVIDNTLGETFLYDAAMNLGILCRRQVWFSADGTNFDEIGVMAEGTQVPVPIDTMYRTDTFRLRIRYRLYDSSSTITLDNFKIIRDTVGIDPSGGDFVIGDEIQFSAVGGQAPFEWSVTNPDVGAITPDGLFTAVGEGITRVSVEDGLGDVAETDDIDVAYMRLTPMSAMVFIDETLQFHVRGGIEPYTWESSDITVGDIDQDGLFTAIGEGTCYVTVTDHDGYWIETDEITVIEGGGGGDPVETLVELTSYPHGPTRIGNSRNIAQAPNGLLYFAYQIASDTAPSRDIRVVRSIDGGATWHEIGKTSDLISGHRRSYHPSIALDGEGVLHMAWYADQTADPRNYKIFYSSFSNGLWSDSEELSTGTSSNRQAAFPALAVDNEGNVLVAYTVLEGQQFKGPNIVKKWQGTWTAPHNINDNMHNAPAVTISPVDGHGVVAWVTSFSNPTNPNTGKIAYMNPDGSHNNTVSVLAGLNYEMPSVAFNPDGDLFYFYNLTSPQGGEVTHFRWKSVVDNTWRRPLVFDGNTLDSVFGSGSATNPMISFNPQVGIDQAGNIYVVAEGAPDNSSPNQRWRIYYNMCPADNNPNLDMRYRIGSWNTIPPAQRVLWDADDDSAFASVPERIFNGPGVLPTVFSDGPLINDNNTGHYPDGTNNNGTWANAYFKSIPLDGGPPVPTPTPTQPGPTNTPLPTNTPFYTNTPIPTNTPFHTNTPLPTNTPTTPPGEPTNTPIPPTPTPTVTPTAAPATPTPTTPPGEPTNTPQPTDTPIPEPTPTPLDETLTATVILNGNMFYPGDMFHLETEIVNGLGAFNVDEYLLLEVYGMFWFYPDWSEDLDYVKRFIDDGTHRQTILEFIWPNVDSGADGLFFYYALFAPDTFDLMSDISYVIFGYAP